MFSGLSLPLLLGLFVSAAGVIWYAGVKLADATDVLSTRWGLGEALGGVVLLAIATNLPEIAIVASAGWSGQIEVAVSNILGGIAIQTVVLAVLDISMKESAPLSSKAKSLVPVLESALVVAMLIVAIMASRLPEQLAFAGLAPGGIALVALWLTGVWIIGRARSGLDWKPAADDSGSVSSNGRSGSSDEGGKGAGLIFGAAALATLAAGVVLERSGDAIADQIGMSGVLFGATVLAAATSLPELSTGIASVRMKEYELAISDIFGGNAFLPALFLLAAVLSGRATLPNAHPSDLYLAGLGALLTLVYLAGLVLRSRRQVLRMGLDSIAVLALYAVAVAGLFAIAGPGG